MVRGPLRNFVNVARMSIVESPMLLRVAIVCAFVVGAASAVAEELAPEQARAFVVGKLFNYTCVVGTIRPGGQAQVRFAALPAGTIKVSSNSMCAHLAGLPIEPCFRVQKIDYRSFRGSISGLSFAYCDFYQRNPRTGIAGASVKRDIAPAPGSATSVATARPSDD